MKRTILLFGCISGLISALWAVGYINFAPRDMNMDKGMWLGYASMLLANVFLVVGVKSYRDKVGGGFISFGKAFKVGFLIALVAATFYVVSWLIYYYSSGTDFIEYWTACMNKQLAESGATPAEIQANAIEMKKFGEMYQNPFFNAAITYTEILPLGTVFALLTALILKRKPKPAL